jgi:hypothetical protein
MTKHFLSAQLKKSFLFFENFKLKLGGGVGGGREGGIFNKKPKRRF